MTTQHIYLDSPASVGALALIKETPGITTADIAKRGGWSVYHMRNVLRYMRNNGAVTSKRIGHECCWWVGVHLVERKVSKPKPVISRAVSSVFALGAQ